MKSFSERNPLIIGVIGAVVIVGDRAGRAELAEAAVPQPGPQLLRLLRRRRRVVHRRRRGSVGLPGGQGVQHRTRRSAVLVTFRIDKAMCTWASAPRPRSRPRACWAPRCLTSSPAVTDPLVGTDPDRSHHVALPIAGRTRRSDHHDQRSEHRPAVGFARHDGANLRQHPAGSAGNAVAGVARFAQTLNERTRSCATCWPTRPRPPDVLAKRTDQIVRPGAAHQLPAGRELQDPERSHWIRSGATSPRCHSNSRHSSPRTAQTLKPALDKLNGVLTIVDDRKAALQDWPSSDSNTYAMSLGESVSSGPFFKAYLVNLLPGQFVQPFIDAAFSDLGARPGHAAAVRSAPILRSASPARRRCRCRIRAPARAASRI